MKKILLLLVASCLSYLSSFAQIVDGINYQAVIVDENGVQIPGVDISGVAIPDKQISIRFTILKGSETGAVQYQETQLTNTDASGLVSLTIGKGSATGASAYNSILDIPWGVDKQFLEVEIDIKGGTNFKIMGIQQMTAIPFALYALNSGSSGSTGANARRCKRH